MNDDFERLIRWYPATWRARYGDELVNLIEDAHGSAKVPRTVSISLMRSGSIERARECGLLRNHLSASDRSRAGSLLVLWGWALFMVAGAIVAKFAEHWQSAVAVAQRTLPAAAFGVVEIAGVLGGLMVLAAAITALPSFAALLRAGRWSEVRRPLTEMAVAGTTAIFFTVGIVVWAHHMNAHQRNGGLFFHGLVFIVWGLTMVFALTTSTAAATAVARRISWSARVLRAFGAMAITLSVLMAGISVGTLIWWTALAQDAPRFLGNGLLATSNVVPPALVVATLLMVLGLTVASIGTVRIVQSARTSRSTI
jgi:hypothetical protein